jgi:hypothetical protein
MNGPWTFGWTQLLTIIGFVITIAIAVGGFGTFGRWRRQKIEERRIDVALEALSIAYEAQGVFAAIRNPGVFGYEWEDMPRTAGESDADWEYKSKGYVPLKRINDQKDFFIRVLKLQPRAMAVFGPEIEGFFSKLHEARAHIQVSGQMLMRRPQPGVQWTEAAQKQRTRMEADIGRGWETCTPKTNFLAATECRRRSTFSRRA